MTLRSIPLHVRILLGLILGVGFGLLFNVDEHALRIGTMQGAERRDVDVREWDSLWLAAGDEVLAFGPDQQLEILHAFARMRKTHATVEVRGVVEGRVFSHSAVELRKVPTIATAIKPIGDIFIRLLIMIAIPLVFASLVVGVASLQDVRRMARIGGKTLTLYIATTILAITIGLTFGNVLQPGHRMDTQARDRLMATYQEDVAARIDEQLGIDMVDYLVNLVPKNPLRAMADAEMLQIIVFAVLFGVALLFIQKDKAKAVTRVLDGVSDAMIALVEMVMWIAPFGVFALIAATIAEFGFGIVQTLLWYVLAVLGGLIFHTFVVYPLLITLFARRTGVRRFLRGIRPAQLVAFTTSSSAATLPVNMECCEEMGAPKSITSFVLPLGATVNMDGTALYQGVAAVFIAQVYGMDLSLSQQLTVVLTATLASIGTAPVPGVGIVMLMIVLRSVGVPESGVALILGVDRLLDMCRTITNITGDAAVAIVVSQGESQKT